MERDATKFPAAGLPDAPEFPAPAESRAGPGAPLLRALAAWPEPARSSLEIEWYPGCGSWLQRVLETHLHLHHLTVSLPEDRVPALLKTMVASRVTHLTLSVSCALFLPVVAHLQLPQVTHLTADHGQSVKPAVLVAFPSLEVLSSLIVGPGVDLSALRRCPRLRTIDHIFVAGFGDENDAVVEWFATTTVEELNDIRLTEQRDSNVYLEGESEGESDTEREEPDATLGTALHRRIVQAITSNPRIRYAVLEDAILVDHPVLK